LTTDPQLQQLSPARPLPPQPPAAPRELTPAVLRRAWGEKHVRVWWLLGLVTLGIVCYYAISRAHAWSHERRLITAGAAVTAEVMHWGKDGEAPKRKVVAADAPVQIRYAYNGATYRPFGVLGGRKTQILTGEMIPVYVDPADPTRWTARTAPGSLAQELLSATLLVPFVVVLFVLALWSRRRVLRVYRHGEAVLAEVVAIGHAAAAPRSRVVRCAVHEGGDDRVIKVVLPAGKAPRVGESLWLIAPPGRPEQGIPAALFE
jgi:hypothetical protein